MPTTIEVQLYKYDELSLKAQTEAREWWRKASADDDFWDHVYEDAKGCAQRLGIEFGQKPIQTVGGVRYEPAIFFRGFSSQGDGAYFEGVWKSKREPIGGLQEPYPSFLDAIKDHAPQDEELHALATDLDRIAAEYPTLNANMKHSGHYYHSGCMQVESWLGAYGDEDDSDVPRRADERLTTAMRFFANWIYKQLEVAHDDYFSDESVADNIRANEYDFEEDGTRTRHA